VSATYVIAEIGVNHDGDVDQAHRLVDAAVAAGADAVKFQLFDADLLTGADAQKAPYQARRTRDDETSREMLRRLELRRDELVELGRHANSLQVDLLATAFDLDGLAFLVDELQVPRLKVASGDLTYGQLLLAAARASRPLIVSTGMAELADVRRALDVIAFGLLQPEGIPPSVQAVDGMSATVEGATGLGRSVTVLHCTTAYPTAADQVNLRALRTLATTFGVPVGYSDHTEGVAVSVAAVALGAVIIEKHITLDRDAVGPDHAASLDPQDFRRLVDGIREVEQALGSGDKAPALSERENILPARRSLVAVRPLARGQVVALEDVDAQRPADAASPLLVWDVVGRPAARDYAVGERIEP
jgi:sialic acid synthase SpsE